MKKRKRIIHVNQHVIKRNRKHNENAPPLTCKTYNKNEYAYEVNLTGTSKVVYSPDKPLSCGAHVWIETHDSIILDGEKILWV